MTHDIKLFNIFPVVHHHLRHALQRMALQFGVVMFYQRHGQILPPQPLGNGPSIWVVTAEFPKVKARYRCNVFVFAGDEGDENLDQLEVPILSFHHFCILLEEGVRVRGSPLKLTGLHLVLVNFPARHFLEVVLKYEVLLLLCTTDGGQF